MSKSLERLHFEREQDELIIEKRFRALRGREVQHLSLGVCVCVWFFSLSYCIPVAPSRYSVVFHYRLMLDLLKYFSTWNRL